MSESFISQVKSEQDILEGDLVSLREKLAEVEQDKTRLENQIQENESSLGWLRKHATNDYDPLRQIISGQQYPCPVCFIHKQTITPMKAINTPSDCDDSYDYFRCGVCGHEDDTNPA